MQGRMYVVTFENVSISAAQDLFEITPADDKPCIVHGFKMSNVAGTADAGDAQEELLRLVCRRGYTSSGSGGSSATPAALNPNAAAASFTAEVNNTSLATTGTTADMDCDGWNIRIPYVWLPTPELRPIVTQAQTSLVVRLVAAPADAVACSGTLWVEEL